MAKLLIVSLPDLPGHVVACAYNDVATETIDCYVVDTSDTDMRNIPANPGDQYRVTLTPKITANLVMAVRDLIGRMQG